MSGRVTRYRLDDLLGAGAMARVYRAHDIAIDRPVAVKLLREQYEDDKVYRERFTREARAAGRLNHPNIIPVYDVGNERGQSYIVMQLIETDGEFLDDMPVPTKSGQGIGLQAETGKFEFRRIRIKEMP